MDELEGSGARDSAERPAKRGKPRFRWGRVVYDEEDAAGQADAPAGERAAGQDAPGGEPSGDATTEDPPETPGSRVFRERRTQERRRHMRLKVALGLSLVTMAVLLMDIVLDRAEESVMTTPPPDILGTWVTDDPRYEDRGFAISAVQFELRLGDGQSSRHAIQSIEAVETGNTWAYEIIYSSPDGEQSFSFFLHPGGILQLKNPPEVVWRREESDGS